MKSSVLGVEFEVFFFCGFQTPVITLLLSDGVPCGVLGSGLFSISLRVFVFGPCEAGVLFRNCGHLPFPLLLHLNDLVGIRATSLTSVSGEHFRLIPGLSSKSCYYGLVSLTLLPRICLLPVKNSHNR